MTLTSLTSLTTTTTIYAKLCFGHVVKRSLCAHLMRVKLRLLTFYSNNRLHAVSVGKPLNGCQVFGQFGFVKPNLNRISVFRTSVQGINICEVAQNVNIILQKNICTHHFINR